ncbi:MAG: TetR/AcrR family transcriptional regulator [Chloroflexota bacterium]|nr:TetR/AcrR family transcriptional regulator [Chloroflexota bacterium]
MARKPADQSVNREAILHAAADAIRRSGYEAVTMKDIAAAVNLTAASLYHHFKNKDALLLAVLEFGMEVIIARVEAIACAPTPADERLRAMIREHIVGVAENTAVGAAMVFEIRALMNVRPPHAPAAPAAAAAYAEFAARRDAFFARRDHFESLFRAVVRDGIDARIFRAVDAPIFVKSLLGAQNWVGVWYKPEGRLSERAIADQIADIFLNSLQENIG